MLPRASAVAVRDGEFVVPGFNDSNVHFQSAAAFHTVVGGRVVYSASSE